MSKPYDATSKDLIEADPAGWVEYLCGLRSPPVRLVDADVSTVTADADKVILVEGSRPWLLHLEFQSNSEEAMDRRLLRYNALLHHRHRLPVASHVVILRASANMPKLTGALKISPPKGPKWQFRYGVLRVWERPFTEFLNGPVGLLPLAPLAHLNQGDLATVVNSLSARIGEFADRPMAAKLWTASYVLMGLRYDESMIESLLSGVLQMEESVTYQAILRRGLQDGLQQGLQQGLRQGYQDGAVGEARKYLLLMGEEKLGAASEAILAKVGRIENAIELESLGKRLFRVSSWEELLAEA